MDYRKELLLASAARLYSLGIDLEAAREKLKRLVERGVSFDSDEMFTAYREYSELHRQWRDLEKQHLDLRNEVLRDSGQPLTEETPENAWAENKTCAE